MEKPLASNYSEAEELCNFAKELNSVTMVGYNRRFGVTFRKAKEILMREHSVSCFSSKDMLILRTSKVARWAKLAQEAPSRIWDAML